MTDPAAPAMWLDPVDNIVYRQYVSEVDGAQRFAVMPAAPGRDGVPEFVDTTPTLPESAVPLVPAFVGAAPTGVRFRVQFVDEIESEDGPSRVFTAVRAAEDGRWRVDGVDRWAYDTSELVIGTPTADPIIHT